MSFEQKPVSASDGNYFYWLDPLRGLAAISVLIWHYQHFYYLMDLPDQSSVIAEQRSIQPFYDIFKIFYHYGGSAVQLFWVMSGFVFASVYVGVKVTAKDFFANRFARLYPLHFVTLVLVGLLQLASHLSVGHFQIYKSNSFRDFILNVLFVSGWGISGSSFNAPIWSVSVELLIYAVFFLIVGQISRWKLGLVLALSALFLLLIKIGEPSGHMILSNKVWAFHILSCGFYFFLGCATYFIWDHAKDWSKLLLVICLVAIVASVLLLPAFTSAQKGLSLQYAILFPAVILLVAVVDRLDRSKRFVRKIRFIGDSTYSIYLLHVPTQITLILIMYAMGVDREAIASTKAFFIFYLGTVLTLAYFTFHYFETPARKYFRRRLKA